MATPGTIMDRIYINIDEIKVCEEILQCYTCTYQ